MRGQLDEDVLTILVLKVHRMKTCDDLFLFQVLCPMYHPSKLDIFNDPRVPYFTSVESFTNIHKFSTGLGGSYEKNWKNIAVTELVLFNGILVRDGILGGSNGTFYKRWNNNSPMYSPEIAQAMTLQRFGKIKSNINLYTNNSAKSIYQEVYDPAYKIDPT